MFNISSSLDKLGNYRVMNQPIGKGVAYGLAFGVTSGLASLVQKYTRVPKPAAMILLALIVKTRMVSSKIGNSAAELISTVAWIVAVDSVVGLAQIGGRLLNYFGIHAEPVTLGVAGSGFGNLMSMGVPAVAAASEGSLGAPYGYDTDYAELAAEPLYLTGAEQKIAGIAL